MTTTCANWFNCMLLQLLTQLGILHFNLTILLGNWRHDIFLCKCFLTEHLRGDKELKQYLSSWVTQAHPLRPSHRPLGCASCLWGGAQSQQTGWPSSEKTTEGQVNVEASCVSQRSHKMGCTYRCTCTSTHSTKLHKHLYSKIHSSTYAYIYQYMYIYTYTWVRICVHVMFTCLCTCLHVYVHVLHTCLHVHACTCLHIYEHLYVYVHTKGNTFFWTWSLPLASLKAVVHY